MAGLFRAVMIFVGSWLVAQLVDAFLRSRPGNAVARQIGHPELGTPAGAGMVASYARGAVGMMLAALFAVQAREEETRPSTQGETLADRIAWISEGLIAASAIARVVADFLRERDEIEELHEATMRGA